MYYARQAVYYIEHNKIAEAYSLSGDSKPVIDKNGEYCFIDKNNYDIKDYKLREYITYAGKEFGSCYEIKNIAFVHNNYNEQISLKKYLNNRIVSLTKDINSYKKILSKLEF